MIAQEEEALLQSYRIKWRPMNSPTINVVLKRILEEDYYATNNEVQWMAIRNNDQANIQDWMSKFGICKTTTIFQETRQILIPSYDLHSIGPHDGGRSRLVSSIPISSSVQLINPHGKEFAKMVQLAFLQKAQQDQQKAEEAKRQEENRIKEYAIRQEKMRKTKEWEAEQARKLMPHSSQLIEKNVRPVKVAVDLKAALELQKERQHTDWARLQKFEDELKFVQNQPWMTIEQKAQIIPKTSKENSLEKVKAFIIRNKVFYIDKKFEDKYEKKRFDLEGKVRFLQNESDFCAKQYPREVIKINKRKVSLAQLRHNDWVELRKDVAARKSSDLESVNQKEAIYRKNIGIENAKNKLHLDELLENCKESEQDVVFGKKCANTFENIIFPHNQKQAIDAFFYIHDLTISPFSDIRKAYKSGSITKFSQIEEYAFERYSPECNSLRILREYQSLFNTILYAPQFVEVIKGDDGQLMIKPAATFSNDDEFRSYIDWYCKLREKPWKINAKPFIDKFAELYMQKYKMEFLASPFDGIKYNIEDGKIFSYKQVRHYCHGKVNKIANALFDSKYLGKLSGNGLFDSYNELDRHQKKLNKAAAKKHTFYSMKKDGHVISFTEKKILSKDLLSVASTSNKLSPMDLELWNNFIDFSKSNHSAFPFLKDCVVFDKFTAEENTCLMDAFKSLLEIYVSGNVLDKEAELMQMISSGEIFNYQQIENYALEYPDSETSKVLNKYGRYLLGIGKGDYKVINKAVKDGRVLIFYSIWEDSGFAYSVNEKLVDQLYDGFKSPSFSKTEIEACFGDVLRQRFMGVIFCTKFKDYKSFEMNYC